MTISGNTVARYQKNGITANGSVAATITNNSVTGAGPIDYIAQNGIQIGFGATARLEGNTVRGNDYTPSSFVACGLLYFEADGVEAAQNKLNDNERNTCNFGKGGGTYNPSP
ncbi:MAG: right-handed parallel beta-helix repeat-containing protein [Betaproteobacteria bacterium]|nr:right-handed parallel beta-helix repeat-containing protein [Betaproteobacteria bacterium]